MWEEHEEVFNEDEAEFLEHTMYVFAWHECVSLTNGEDEVMADTITLQEALMLIQQGYTAVPF